MVATHEGEASAQLLAHWLARQPQAVLVVRQTEGKTELNFTPVGFMMLALHQVAAADLQLDPAIQAVWNYLQMSGSLDQARRRHSAAFGWRATLIKPFHRSKVSCLLTSFGTMSLLPI